MKKIIFVFLFFSSVARAQSPEPVVTAFPSLRIPASSRGMCMGNVGIASSVDNQVIVYNVAKSAFTQNFHQVSVNYTPWLTTVSDDTKFFGVNYLANVFNTSAFGIAVNYLSAGTFAMRDNNGATIAEYKAREYTIGASYALQINENNAVGISLRMLGQTAFTDAPRNVFSFCGDIGYYGFTKIGGDANRRIEWGAVLSNLGPKLNLPGSAAKTFLPSNLGIGISYNAGDEDGNQFTAALDLNKLLVPSEVHSDKGVLSGMLASFQDPLREEIKEIRIGAGIEYGFINEFFLRGGLSLEHPLKGNHTFLGLGAGYKGNVMDQSFGLDFHWLVPLGTTAVVSPFQNVLGFTLKINLGNFQ